MVKMNTEEWFDKAIAYFNGMMTTEQAQLFEKETAASEELSKLMQTWKTTDEEAALYEKNRQETEAFIYTHQKLKSDFVNDDVKVKKLKYSPWRWVAIAAAVTGIIMLMKIFTPSPDKSSFADEHKKKLDTTHKIVAVDSPVATIDTQLKKRDIQLRTLYAQVFRPDEVPEDPNGPLDNAFFYYASKQYKKAITAIDSAGSKTLTRGSDSFTPITKFYAAYYKALSLLTLGNDSGAVKLLAQSVSLAPSAFLKAKAQWYLALAYLKQENVQTAIETLGILIKNPYAGGYKQKAEKLLSELNK